MTLASDRVGRSTGKRNLAGCQGRLRNDYGSATSGLQPPPLSLNACEYANLDCCFVPGQVDPRMMQ